MLSQYYVKVENWEFSLLGAMLYTPHKLESIKTGNLKRNLVPILTGKYIKPMLRNGQKCCLWRVSAML